MTTPDMTNILEELAAGRIDAAEAARRIDALKAAEPATSPEPRTFPRPDLPEVGGPVCRRTSR